MELKFTDANFEEEVLQSEIPVLVDFYADWCVPCKMMAPIIKDLAEKYEGRVKVGKLNIEENPEMAGKYKIMTIPTCLVVKDGKEMETTRGSVSKSELENILERVLA